MKMKSLKTFGFLALSLLAFEAYSTPANTDMPQSQEEMLALREQEAFNLFMELLTCPVNQVPTWKEFVDKITKLMEGNPKYAALRASLLSVRDVTGMFAKVKIAKVLQDHEAAIPQEIVTKTQSLKISERIDRIKLS